MKDIKGVKNLADVRKLSTGEDSTLRNWIDLTDVFFGQESAQSKFLRNKAEEQGYDQEVIATEGQLLSFLMSLKNDGSETK